MLSKNKWVQYLILIGLGFIGSANYILFVFPNSFAPAGLNGIATMIQYLFNFKLTYMSLLINIPLCVITFLVGSKEFALKNAAYFLSFSLFLILLGEGGILDISSVGYSNYWETIDGAQVYRDASMILGPVAAGIINGFVYGTAIRLNGATGGSDFLAKIIHKYHPEFSFVWIIFVLNASVAILSFFVYGMKFGPVICCLMYTFITTTVSDYILKGTKSAIKFEVVTDKPQELSDDIIKELNHAATVCKATGMFSHSDKALLICVINKRQTVDFENILKRYPGSFAYMESVNQTLGNFTRSKTKHIVSPDEED